MRLLSSVLLLISNMAIADICVCQFPKLDARYGDAYPGEIGFYKLGCAFWLMTQGCRQKNIVDINNPLDQILKGKIRKNELIRIGFVGHWNSSRETNRYLESEIKPLIAETSSSIYIENTACSAMDDPELVQNFLSTLDLNPGQFVHLKGNQTTSIGMWDKLSIRFNKADLYAAADSRILNPIFPSCEKFYAKRCTEYQIKEYGTCQNKFNEKKELICLNKTIVNNRNPEGRKLKAKIWQYREEKIN